MHCVCTDDNSSEGWLQFNFVHEETVCGKKILYPERGLNCCTSAWRWGLLPTGLLGSVNWC